MILNLFSIKKHNSSNSSSKNNTLYSVCLVMDPHEASGEKDTCGPINDTGFNITITNYFLY